MVNNKLEFTGSEFFDVLKEFQDRVKEGSYKKTVPYDVWRKLKLTQKPVSFDFIEDYQLGEILFDEGHSYSEYFSEEGLIAFLYDIWIVNVKEEDDKMTLGTSEATLAANITDIADIDITKVAGVSNKINSIDQPSISDYITGGYVNTGTTTLTVTDILKEDVDDLKRKLGILNIDTTAIHSKNVENEKNIEILEDKMREIQYQQLAYLNSRIDDLVNSMEELNNKYSTLDEIIYNIHTEFEEQKTTLVTKVDKIESEVEINESKENKRMKNFNFDFGPCTNDNVRMSMYGLAVKNADGTYVSFNPATREIIDVDILNFDGGKYMYKMPVATKDVAVGDVIIHQRKPMFVEGFTELGGVMAVDPVAGERKEILPTKNMFNFNFVTKVVSLFNMCGTATPTTEQPFGNMLPFMLMGEEGGDIDPMMLMFMMNQSGGANTSVFGNPMMMYFLMKDKNKSDIDPMMLMFMGQSQTPCQCNCGDTHNA